MRRQRTDVVEEMAVALRTSGVLPGKDLDWSTTLQPVRDEDNKKKTTMSGCLLFLTPSQI